MLNYVVHKTMDDMLAYEKEMYVPSPVTKRIPPTEEEYAQACALSESVVKWAENVILDKKSKRT